MDFSLEKTFQDEIYTNAEIQKGICDCIGINYGDIKLVKEDTYINGITTDFTLFQNDSVKAILECKGGAIGVTDYVRGIGQIFQYEYFAQNSYSSKNYKFCNFDEFSSIYIFPDTVLRLNEFNVGLFKYPNSKKIIEVNSKNLAVRLIDDKELEKLRE